MKNITIYIGTTKRDKFIEDLSVTPLFREETKTTSTRNNRYHPYILIDNQVLETKRYGHKLFACIPVNKKAVLIERKGTVYEYKDNFINNLMIYLNLWLLPIRLEESYMDQIYYDKKTLTPFYDQQQKKLSLNKLRNDLLCNQITETKIKH